MIVIRTHGPGDLGWLLERHAVLYAQEHGWGQPFEALVAEIAADFLKTCDPAREGCWIAERNGQRLGAIMLVRKDDEAAKLRLFLVDPAARGLGVGTRLVEHLIAFARQAGYRKIVLWTQSVLVAARRIYERAGFQCIAVEQHCSFGHDLTGETWELSLE